MPATITYLTLGAGDLAAAKTFYDVVMPVLGWSRFNEFPGFVAYGPDGSGDGQTLWLCNPFDGQAASAGNGAMLAFGAENRAQVDAFHAAALAAGAVCEGPPGPRPHYTPTWYAAYLRDPTGNKLAIVHDRPEDGA